MNQCFEGVGQWLRLNMKKLNLDNTLVILVGKAPEELTLDVVDIHRAKMSGAVNRRAFLWLHLIFHLLSNTQATLHNLGLIYLKDFICLLCQLQFSSCHFLILSPHLSVQQLLMVSSFQQVSYPVEQPP